MAIKEYFPNEFNPLWGFIADYCTKMKELNIEPKEVIKSLEDIFTKLVFGHHGFKETVTVLYGCGCGFSYNQALSLFDTLDFIAEYTGKIYHEIIAQMAQSADRKEKRLFAVVKEYIVNTTGKKSA